MVLSASTALGSTQESYPDSMDHTREPDCGVGDSSEDGGHGCEHTGANDSAAVGLAMPLGAAMARQHRSFQQYASTQTQPRHAL